MAERVLAQRPPPQFSEHLEPSQPQVETLQSTGQAKVLQVVVEERAGQAEPPCCWATVTMRVLVLWPVPQDLEHGPHGAKAVCVQSVGHGWSPHTRSCVRSGQATPPKAG